MENLKSFFGELIFPPQDFDARKYMQEEIWQ